MTDTLFYIDPSGIDTQPERFSVEEKRILDIINQKVAASETLQDMMDFLLAQLHIICSCDRIGLAFMEENAARVIAHECKTHYEPVLLGKGYAEDLNVTSLKEVIQHGTPRIIGDLESYISSHPESPSTRILLREGIRSSMTCPLRVGDRNVGLFFISSRSAHSYGNHEAALQLAMTERLSQAVEKAYRIEQLAEANRSYMEMLAFVTHELKSPLSAIIMQGQTLTHGYRGELNAEQKETIDKMILQGEYLTGLIGEYLNLARIETDDFHLALRSGINLWSEVIQHSIELAEPSIIKKEMHLNLEETDRNILAECDPELLKIVIVNLLGNAAKYGFTRGEIRLRVSQDSNSITLAIWNEGPGFPEKDRHRLFRKFSRLQSPELLKEKGTGVGLYTSWRIIKLHGGRILANSNPGHWAEFRFTLPQPIPKPHPGTI